MYSEDINGSKAYCRILILCKLLSEEEGNLICEGLDQIETEWQENRFVIKDNDEDIHTANERRLTVMELNLLNYSQHIHKYSINWINIHTRYINVYLMIIDGI